ncbi:hypothetical protein G9C85_06000 [Halorubellus sp. JP-L1]|uniref:hypothetical protein n=1 Tax=Halorubellus sp. JP-L1 TaxID=2715753 RepID=UPI001408389C|nr:hypothetical protein [Halorubellus sp. JP-L1]NHN41189.1 hypothetical protein [Halorubellus sp. JP-L1]
MQDRTFLALALALTLVLAGCTGGSDRTTASSTIATTDGATTESETTATTDGATTEPTGTESTGTESTTVADPPEVKTENCRYGGEGDDEIVRESGACLPFDADTVYRRVLEMAGVDLDEGPTLRAIPARETDRFEFGFNDATFGATMGIAPDGPPSVFVPGFAQPNQNPDGTVSPAVTMRYVGLWNDSALQDDLDITYTARDAEVTAAHEFLHVVQFYRGSQQRLARNLTSEGVNLADVELAVVEGSATFFEAEYQREHMNESDAGRNRSAWANASAYAMAQLGPYVTGADYARWYLNGSTENFEKLYDDPPVSMEQIIHKYEPDEELPKNLSVNGEVSSEWATPSFPETRGELFLRSALRSGVNGSQAARGAAGWGQDRVVAFQNTSFSPQGYYKYGWGWTIRFDDATEAAEFETIFQEWLEAKDLRESGVYGEDEHETFRLIEVSDETVVVLAGHEDFTTQATASGNTTQVVVEHTSRDQTGEDEDEDEWTEEGDGNQTVTAIWAGRSAA